MISRWSSAGNARRCAFSVETVGLVSEAWGCRGGAPRSRTRGRSSRSRRGPARRRRPTRARRLVLGAPRGAARLNIHYYGGAPGPRRRLNIQDNSSLEFVRQPGAAGRPALAPWLRLELVVTLGQPLLFAGALGACFGCRSLTSSMLKSKPLRMLTSGGLAPGSVDLLRGGSATRSEYRRASRSRAH